MPSRSLFCVKKKFSVRLSFSAHSFKGLADSQAPSSSMFRKDITIQLAKISFVKCHMNNPLVLTTTRMILNVLPLPQIGSILINICHL